MIIKQEKIQSDANAFLIKETAFDQFRNASFVQDKRMNIDVSLYAQGNNRTVADEEHIDPLQEAYERGRNDGYQQGQQEERTRWTQEFNVRERECLELATRLENWCATLERDKQLFLRELSAGLLDTVMAISETIIGETAKGTVKAVEFVLEKAFDKVHEQSVSEIHLHPADLQRLDNYDSEVIKRIRAQQGIIIVEDASLAEGGVRLITDSSLVDASIRAQMREVRDYIDKIRESEGYDD